MFYHIGFLEKVALLVGAERMEPLGGSHSTCKTSVRGPRNILLKFGIFFILFFHSSFLLSFSFFSIFISFFSFPFLSTFLSFVLFSFLPTFFPFLFFYFIFPLFLFFSSLFFFFLFFFFLLLGRTQPLQKYRGGRLLTWFKKSYKNSL